MKICFHHIHWTTTSMFIFVFNNLFPNTWRNVQLTFEKIFICLFIFSVYSNFNLMIFKCIPLTVKWFCILTLVTLLLIQEWFNLFLNLNMPYIFERDYSLKVPFIQFHIWYDLLIHDVTFVKNKKKCFIILL